MISNSLSICLMSVALLAMFLIRGFIVTPAHAFIFTWLVGLVSIESKGNLAVVQMDPWGQELFFLVALACLGGFFVAEILVSYGPSRPRKLRERQLSAQDAEKWLPWLSLPIMFSGILSLSYALISNNFSLHDIRQVNFAGYESRPFEVYCNYVTSIGFVLIPYSINAQIVGGRLSSWPMIAILIGAAAQAISFGGRIYLVTAALFTLVAIMAHGRAGMIYIKKRLLTVSLAVVAVIALFRMVETLRQNTLTEDRRSRDIMTIVLQPFEYNDLSIAGIGRFCSYAEEAEMQYGTNLFAGFIALAEKFEPGRFRSYRDTFGSEALKKASTEEHRLGWTQTGAIPQLYADFRMGMLLVFFVISVISQYFYHYFRETNGFGHFLGLWGAYCMMYTPQAAHWFSQISIYVVSVAAAFAFLTAKRRS